MNELQVTVNQIPGVITWNYEELKQELAAQMAVYKSIVYTDDTIANAKADIAALRKLSKAVNARKLEIKNKCLEPYEAIEQQARELISLIDEPIVLISEKIDDFESRRRMAKKEKIMNAMAEAFSDLPADIRKKLECKCYDNRWLNATSPEKAYKESIQKAHDEVRDALRLLQNVDPDFRDEVMSSYKTDLDVTKAMLKAQELQKQKERVLERERQRQEQERILKEAEARRAAEAAASTPVVSEEMKTEAEAPKMPISEAPKTDPAAQALEPKQEASPAKNDGRRVYQILIRATDSELKKILSYIKYTGVDCRVRG